MQQPAEALVIDTERVKIIPAPLLTLQLAREGTEHRNNEQRTQTYN